MATSSAATLMGAENAPFVLIHGGWHGAWCWERIVPRLQAAGRTVIAPDLPGHGRDTTPAASITLDDYVERIGEGLRSLDRPAVLVGHSLGGIAIAATCERYPERVRQAVYLSAFLLRPGACAFPPELVGEDGDKDEIPYPEEGIAACYTDVSAEDEQWARLQLTPTLPARPVRTAMVLTESRYEQVPRDYIECTEDRAIPVRQQREWIVASACRRVVSLRSGHSPFLSQPERLTAVLLDLATGVH